GLVHINRQLKRAEISLVINTSLEKKYFFEYWDTFLKLIEQIALNLLDIKNIFTYAFDLRPELYEVLNANNFVFVRDEKYIKSGKIIDVKIHNKKIRNE
ncbi:ribosomal-protein-serine acetyltransferase, partial [Flavobacteriaceae bacterium]|nr:ribosomal-protein-serine acetyltransferase [Flavobacteriaceae bacterium]